MKNKWISVEDRLPEMDEDVLTYNMHSGGFDVGSYSGGLAKGYSYRWLTNGVESFVTHWQPLPKPPKGDN